MSAMHGRRSKRPGFAGTLSDHKAQSVRPEITDKQEKISQARQMLGVSVGTISGWLSQ
jgi:hypothetical protein